MESKTVQNFNKKVILFNRDYHKYEETIGKHKYYDVLWELNHSYEDKKSILYYNSITKRTDIVDCENYPKKKNIKDCITHPIILPIRIYIYIYLLRFLSMQLGAGVIFIFMSITIIEFVNIVKYLYKILYKILDKILNVF